MYTFKKLHPARLLPVILLAIFAGSCIENDLPYPWVQPNVTVFEVERTDQEGHELLASATVIDSADRTITLHLSEWANIEAVRVTEFELSEGSVLIAPESLPSSIDLSQPFAMTLGLYDRTFEWTIRATQEIERYFTIGSQISTSVIDPENHTVKALVPTGQPLDAIQVRTIKLGGNSAVMTPDLAGKTVDFTQPVKVKVTEFGESVEWTISVEQTDVSVEIESIDAWTKVAWIYASAESGKENGIEYRLASEEEWTVAPDDWLTVNGGSITACLRHLQPMTEYVVRAFSGEDHTAELSFTTESEVQLPNSDFTQWWLNSKVWNPWPENGESFWDTGNRGAATLGQSNTIPLENPASATGYQGAVLQTKFIGVGVFGKLAAGNLFAGSYVRTEGTNGVLAFGREFNRRPTGLKARLKYSTAPISNVSTSNPNLSHMKGQPDTCIVWCALADWNEPFEIRTSPSNRQLFERTDPHVIAYGEMTSGDSIEDFVDVVINFDYVATDRVPSYILLTASASKYGDYFTGGQGAVLTLLSYELLYDY